MKAEWDIWYQENEMDSAISDGITYTINQAKRKMKELQKEGKIHIRMYAEYGVVTDESKRMYYTILPDGTFIKENNQLNN